MPRASVAGAIEAGKAVVRAIFDTSQMEHALAMSESQLRAWGERIQRLGRTIAAAGVAGAALFIKPIREVANAEQLLGRFDAVFAEFSQNAGNYADDLAKRINQSGLTLRDQLAQFNAYLKGIGFDPAQANAMSKQLTAWANDWIAFDDTIVNGQESIDLFLSALSGEVRPARRMGADLRQLALDAEAAAQGLGKSIDLTEKQRLLLRKTILERALTRSGVIGQAEREVNTLAAVFRGVKAGFRDLSVAVGFAVIKPFTQLTAGFRAYLDQLMRIVRENPAAVSAFAKLSLSAIGLGASLEILGRSIAAMKVRQWAMDLGVVVSNLTTLVKVHPYAAATIAGVSVAIVGLTRAFVQAGGGWNRFGSIAKQVGKDFALAMKTMSLAIADYDIESALKIAALAFERGVLQFASGMKGWEELGYAFIHIVKTMAFQLKVLGNAIKMVFDLLMLPFRTYGGFSEDFMGGTTWTDDMKNRIEEINREIAELEEKITGGAPKKPQDEYARRMRLLKLDPATGLPDKNRTFLLDDGKDRRTWKEKYNSEWNKMVRAFTMYGPFNKPMLRQVTKPFYMLRDAAEKAAEAIQPLVDFFAKIRFSEKFAEDVTKNIIGGAAPAITPFSAATSFGSGNATWNALQIGASVEMDQLSTLKRIADNTDRLPDKTVWEELGFVKTNNE